jgi:hypothetical protein
MSAFGGKADNSSRDSPLWVIRALPEIRGVGDQVRPIAVVAYDNVFREYMPRGWQLAELIAELREAFEQLEVKLN